MIVFSLLRRVPWYVWLFLIGIAVGAYMNRTHIMSLTKSMKTKSTQKSKTRSKNNKVITTRETIEKDGTRVIETTTLDKSVVSEETAENHSEYKKSSETKEVEKQTVSDWRIGVGINGQTDINDLQLRPELKFQHRVTGPFWMNVEADTKGQVGVGVEVEF